MRPAAYPSADFFLGHVRPCHSITALSRARGICLSLTLFFATTGCAVKAVNRSVSGPDTPRALRVNKAHDEAVLAEVKNFLNGKCLDDATQTCAQSTAERNRIIYDLKLIIDQNFEQYAKNYEQTSDTRLLRARWPQRVFQGLQR
jgi:hypothetical protein